MNGHTQKTGNEPMNEWMNADRFLTMIDKKRLNSNEKEVQFFKACRCWFREKPSTRNLLTWLMK